jgi:hypothetical protein
MRYRLEVRLTSADVGKRVVIRWRPGPADSKQATDVLGILEQADAGSFAVRTRDGTLVVIPAGRALAGKVVPPPPARRRHPSPRAPRAAPPLIRPGHRHAAPPSPRRPGPPTAAHLTSDAAPIAAPRPRIVAREPLDGLFRARSRSDCPRSAPGQAGQARTRRRIPVHGARGS